MKRLSMVVAAVAMMSSCIRSPVAMMTASKPLTQGQYTELGPVEETDCLWYLFGVFPISSGNNFQDALNDATRQRNADALVQVTAETYYQNFLVIARYCTIVQGIAVKSR